jgi:hypothetical protein
LTISFEILEDLNSGLAAYEGVGILVPGGGPSDDVVGQLAGVVVRRAAEFLDGQLGEPSLNRQDPGACRRWRHYYLPRTDGVSK